VVSGVDQTFVGYDDEYESIGEMRLLRKKEKRTRQKDQGLRRPRTKNSPEKIVLKFNVFPRQQAKGLKRIV
jgi:hypothetical protein